MWKSFLAWKDALEISHPDQVCSISNCYCDANRKILISSFITATEDNPNPEPETTRNVTLEVIRLSETQTFKAKNETE